MMRSLLSFLLIIASVTLHAAEPADSISHGRWQPAPQRYIPAAIGAGMLAEGAIATAAAPATSHTWARKHSSTAVDVAQYAPIVFPWAIKTFGGKTRSGWGRMAASQAISAVLMVGTVESTKTIAGHWRPNRSDNRSFPSGHTAWAFLGATMTAIELADQSPWYAVGAYTFASGIAMQRVISENHFPSDVVAGAGIGILAAEIGYYLGDAIFNHHDLANPGRPFEEASQNPSFVGLATRMSIPLTQIQGLTLLPGISSGVTGAWAFGRFWSVGAEVTLQSTPILVESTFAGMQNSIGMALAPRFILPLSRRASFTASISGGYARHLSLSTPDDALTSGKGTPQGGISAGATLALTKSLSVEASAGYQLSRYCFTLRGSENLCGTLSSLSLGVTTRINL